MALVLFDGDDAFLADLLHRLGQDVADLRVAVGADGADLGDLFLVARRLGERLQRFDDLRSTAMSMPRFRSIGLCPASTSLSPSP